MNQAHSSQREPTEAELKQIKEKLKKGSLTPADLQVLQGLIERTEKSAQMLRAAIVE